MTPSPGALLLLVLCPPHVLPCFMAFHMPLAVSLVPLPSFPIPPTCLLFPYLLGIT